MTSISARRDDDPLRVGPFRVIGRVGAGGMGQVFVGRDGGGRTVAVKVIRLDLAGEPGFRERFAREVAVARRARGRFVAPLVDADPDGSPPWLATRFLAGPNLAEAVESYGPLPVGTVLELASGLAAALADLHAKGIVHRDLKPGNVILLADGPHVIDFGISRASGMSTMTRVGEWLGSPGFIAPEQVLGDDTTGSAGDVFALGALMCFAATGAGPFGHGQAPALMYRVVYEPPDLDDVPAEIRDLVADCLAKRPDDRPPVEDLLAQLLTVAAGERPDGDWLPDAVAAEISDRRRDLRRLSGTRPPRARRTPDTETRTPGTETRAARPSVRRPARAVVAATEIRRRPDGRAGTTTGTGRRSVSAVPGTASAARDLAAAVRESVRAAGRNRWSGVAGLATATVIAGAAIGYVGLSDTGAEATRAAQPPATRRASPSADTASPVPLTPTNAPPADCSALAPPTPPRDEPGETGEPESLETAEPMAGVSSPRKYVLRTDPLTRCLQTAVGETLELEADVPHSFQGKYTSAACDRIHIKLTDFYYPTHARACLRTPDRQEVTDCSEWILLSGVGTWDTFPIPVEGRTAWDLEFYSNVILLVAASDGRRSRPPGSRRPRQSPRRVT